MARLARVIAAGNTPRCHPAGKAEVDHTFYREEDYQAYMGLMGEWRRKCSMEIWAYSLMPNHIHLITVTESEEGLRRCIGEAHQRYSRMINFRENRRGNL